MKIMDEDDMKNDGVYNLDIKKMVDCGEVILEERTIIEKGGEIQDGGRPQPREAYPSARAAPVVP